MSTIEPIKTEQGLVYVEVAEGDVPTTVETDQLQLPEGAEPTGVREAIADTMTNLRASIASMAAAASAALVDSAPTEWSVEFNIRFKGKTSPIPVILSGEAKSSLKVLAKWKQA